MTILNRFRHSRALALLTFVTLVTPLVPVSAFAQTATNPPSAPPFAQGGSAAAAPSEAGPAGVATLAAASVDPQTGVFHASIPFELPTARGAIQPTLSLNYSSVGGVGEGGLGWSLSLPSIERHNPSGLPRPLNDPAAYSPINPADQDRFTWGGQPLVPICEIGGACPLLPAEQLPSWAVAGWHYYRLETEDGSLARFFWSPEHLRWVVQFGNGEAAEYGAPGDNISDISGTDYVSLYVGADQKNVPVRWNLIRRYDAQRSTSGSATNVIVYKWSGTSIVPRFGSTAVPLGPRGVLTDIYDTAPATSTASTPPLVAFAHHVHLLYDTPFTGQAVGAASPVPSLATPAALLTGVDVTSLDYGGGTPSPNTVRQQVRRYWLGVSDVPGTITPAEVNSGWSWKAVVSRTILRR